MTAIDSAAVSAEIESRIQAMSAPGASVGVAEAQELLRLVMSLYGAGLERVLDVVRAERGGPEAVLRRFAADPLIASLLALHDLQPDARPTLIQIRRPSKAEPASAPASVRSHDACEICGAAVPGGHRHAIDVEKRRILCACDTCVSAGGRFRGIPDRYLHAPSMTIAPAQWDALAIPVGLVFFFVNSHLDRTVACYPGPAGATESLLPLDAWPALAGTTPWIAALAPDVEALLVRRAGEEYLCYIVPIDVCYELVGRVRQAWTGLNGGAAVERELERFFDTVHERSADPSARAVAAASAAEARP